MDLPPNLPSKPTQINDQTVFVDALAACVPNRRWKWSESAHLTSCDLDALHAFALRIGLKRTWFQNDRRCPHYDLTRGANARAIAAGAVELDRRGMFEMIR